MCTTHDHPIHTPLKIHTSKYIFHSGRLHLVLFTLVVIILEVIILLLLQQLLQPASRNR